MTTPTPKTILVTGFSKSDGVGFNLVNNLLAQGHRVIATVRDEMTVNWEMKQLPNPHLFDIYSLDLCHTETIAPFAASILKKYGYIDVLVNNAANVMVGPIETASEQNMLVTFQTKVFSPILLIQQFISCMRERKQGSFITTSSIFCAEDFGIPGLGIYLSALHAFERMQEALAVELKPWNINVINFQPGPITTSLTRHAGKHTDIESRYYPDFTNKTYQYLQQRCELQSAKEVAVIYADIINGNWNTLTVQSNDFGRNYVKQFHSPDDEKNYLEAWC